MFTDTHAYLKVSTSMFMNAAVGLRVYNTCTIALSIFIKHIHAHMYTHTHTHIIDYNWIAHVPFRNSHMKTSTSKTELLKTTFDQKGWPYDMVHLHAVS